MPNHIHPTNEAGKRFYIDYQKKGAVVMLNLLQFKKIADYTGEEQLASDDDISGKEAYNLYMSFTKPLLEKAGGEVLFIGKSNHFLIGPEKESWDCVLLVKYKNVESFMAFATDETYLKTLGHRTAALANSRLLPINEM